MHCFFATCRLCFHSRLPLQVMMCSLLTSVAWIVFLTVRYFVISSSNAFGHLIAYAIIHAKVT